MKLNNIVACICEGNAEHALLDILLKHDLLIFSELLDDKIIRERSAKKFEENYLRSGFSEKISIVRILDSRKENFRLSKLYVDRVDVINIITSPEIEILIIISEGKHSDYKKYSSTMKPSTYCQTILKLKNIKSYEFVKEYFSDVNKLVLALSEYKRISKRRKNELTIFDILK